MSITTNINVVLKDFKRDVDSTLKRNVEDQTLQLLFADHAAHDAVASTPDCHAGHVCLLGRSNPRIDFVIQRVSPNTDRFDVLVRVDGKTTSTGIIEYRDQQLVNKERPTTYQTALDRLVTALHA